jgi:hypothetical protein
MMWFNTTLNNFIKDFRIWNEKGVNIY